MKTKFFCLIACACIGFAVCTSTASATAVSADGGGIHVRSDDNVFTTNLGGEIQFDGYTTVSDDQSKFNSGVADNASGTYFRRVELTLSGHLYGFHYLVVENLAASSTSSGLYQIWIAHRVGPGMLFLGQHRPWRSFDDMTSNRDTLFLERNVLSDKGIIGGRQFAQGLFYRVLLKHPLFRHDHLFVGVSAYSLGNTVQSNDPQKGVGYNFRIAYAPIVEHDRWLHIGGSFSSDRAGNGHPMRAYFKGYYGYKGDTQMVVDMKANSSGVHNPRVNTEELEMAGAYGPFFLKVGAAWAQFRQSGAPSQNVRAYSVEGSVFLTGETRPYYIHRAAMKTPDPKHSWGALELAFGFNYIHNANFATGDIHNCHRGDSVGYPHSRYTACQVSNITAALNYYYTPNVRFTLEGIRGDAHLGSVRPVQDRPYTVEARAQLAW